MKMIVGYARTSTIEQEAGFEHQLKKLKENKCEKIFKNKFQLTQIEMN